MTVFQLITILISGAMLFIMIMGVFVSTKVDIAKLQVQISSLRNELNGKEAAFLKYEEINRIDHKEMIERLNRLIELK